MPGALVGAFGRYELGAEVVTIGRSSSNQVVIQDELVSGRHLQVQPQGPEYLVIDVGSSNGTQVNGQRLPAQTPRPLRHGDVILIGSSSITVEIALAKLPASPALAQPGPGAFTPSEQVFGPPAAQLDGTPFGAYAPPPGPQPFGGPMPTPQQYNPQAAPQQPFAAPAAAPQPYAGPVSAGFPPPGGTPEFSGFPPYPGNAAAGPAYYPGQPPPGAPPGTYPAPGFAPPPVKTGAKTRRPALIIGGVLAVLIILAGTGLAVFALTRSNTPPIPDATAQTIQPFYNALEKQDYTTAAKFFSPTFTKEHTDAAHVAKLLESFDTIRGKITSYKINHATGSTSLQSASVNVTRDPTKGTFGPDTLQLVYLQSKWQINEWTPGPGQKSSTLITAG